MGTVKEEIRSLLEELPDDVTYDEVQYHIYVREQIGKGLADLAAGRTISHEEVKRRLREKWLRGADGKSGPTLHGPSSMMPSTTLHA
jgi:hypothetical protein